MSAAKEEQIYIHTRGILRDIFSRDLFLLLAILWNNNNSNSSNGLPGVLIPRGPHSVEIGKRVAI